MFLNTNFQPTGKIVGPVIFGSILQQWKMMQAISTIYSDVLSAYRVFYRLFIEQDVIRFIHKLD